MRQIDERMRLYLAELQGLVRGFLFREREAQVMRSAAVHRAIRANDASLHFARTAVGEVASCLGNCFACDKLYPTCECGREYIEAQGVVNHTRDVQTSVAYMREITQRAQSAIEDFLRLGGALSGEQSIKLQEALSWREAVMEQRRWAA
jgi:hypothetical protein